MAAVDGRMKQMLSLDKNDYLVRHNTHNYNNIQGLHLYCSVLNQGHLLYL